MDMNFFTLYHVIYLPLIAGEVVRALRHTYSLILRVNNLKRRVTKCFGHFSSENTTKKQFDKM